MYSIKINLVSSVLMYAMLQCAISYAYAKPSVLWVPDNYTRHKIKNITSQQVEKLIFYGIDLRVSGEDPIQITDKLEIQKYLVALNHAEGIKSDSLLSHSTVSHSTGSLNILEIHLKRTSWDSVDMLKFGFNPLRADSCYGPEFYNLIVSSLPKRRAEQIRRSIRYMIQDIQGVDIGTIYGNQTIKDPQEVSAVINALENLDEKAFPFNKQKNFTVFVGFELSNGEKNLFLEFNLTRSPYSKSKEKPEIPEAIWKYCGK